ncbi:cobalamin-dependent protein [Phyllobacterium sp. SB3]|uniref:cobalamin-dependent protein n=1 Tax=Phyllobacterium sp. SB3 TaxID=3156073 RepID=UPI0032AFB25B
MRVWRYRFRRIGRPLVPDPGRSGRHGVKSQVHVVGISSLAAGHKTLAPQLVKALKGRGAEHIVVVVGGVIPRQDYDFLLQNEVSAVFGPGTNVLEAARAIIDLMQGNLRNQ